MTEGWKARLWSSDFVSLYTSQGMGLDRVSKERLDSHVLKFLADLIPQQGRHRTENFHPRSRWGQVPSFVTNAWLVRGLWRQLCLLPTPELGNCQGVLLSAFKFRVLESSWGNTTRMEILCHKIWASFNSTNYWKLLSEYQFHLAYCFHTQGAKRFSIMLHPHLHLGFSDFLFSDGFKRLTCFDIYIFDY